LWGSAFLLIGLTAAAIYKSKTRVRGEEVETAKVETRSIKEIVSASGKIFPEKEVIISSDVSGEVVHLYVEEGDSVKATQLLALIDPEAYVSSVERGQAAVNNTQAQLSVSRSGLENVQAQKEQVIAQYKHAERIYKRNQQLLEEGVISIAEFETSLAEWESAEANLKAIEASLRSAGETVNASQFTVKSAEATLRELRTSLRKTSIFAPVDGIISKLNIEEGERVVGTIQMAGTEMMRIANLSVMEVQIDVSENDIVKVSEGDSASIEVDAYLDHKFSGVVTKIANSASNVRTQQTLNTDQVTNFIVKIRIDPGSYANLISTKGNFPFRPGMSASVDINTHTEEDVLTVPILAVTTRDASQDQQGGDQDTGADLKEVVFVCRGDTVDMVKIISGIQDDKFIHILSGLSLNEEVVSGPYSTVSRKLKAGAQYHKKKEDKKKSKKSEDKS